MRVGSAGDIGVNERAGLVPPVGQVAEAVDVSVLLPADSPRSGGVSEDYVRELAQSGEPLAPIVVQRSTLRVIDGMHRLRAAMLRGRRCIDVRFFDGTDQEAFVLAVRLNVEQGLPLSQADRAAAAARILHDRPQWSDQMIAVATGISGKTVASIRRRSTVEIPKSNTRIGRDGRHRPLSTAEGRLRAGELLARNPRTPLREIAERAGIALGTARDVKERLRMGRHPVPPRQRTASEQDILPGNGFLNEEAEERSARELLAELMAKLGVLGRDPAVRLNEEGRAVLRLLGAHGAGLRDCERIADNVPPHSRAAMIEAAGKCAEVWQHFARRLELRDDTGS
ncbi:ParB N-terminal domain-containing protein [Amycolatopsis sp. lyj-112]|uniref:ParB N-terminal domain-containing protein n=1 Tax=Amycolatopsis sp. lyj-112 TaxID=2789288 RepID=UPI0039782048